MTVVIALQMHDQYARGVVLKTIGLAHNIPESHRTCMDTANICTGLSTQVQHSISEQKKTSQGTVQFLASILHCCQKLSNIELMFSQV